MINNRKTVKCDRCGKSGHLTVTADGFDDAPETFTVTKDCEGPCEKVYWSLKAEEMHKVTGLPLAGWSEARH